MSCAAVDQSGNAAVLAGGKWTVASLGTTAITISCPVSGFCAATNAAGGALLYQNGTWSRVADVDGTAMIGSLNCASQMFCVAIDHEGRAVYYRPE